MKSISCLFLCIVSFNMAFAQKTIGKIVRMDPALDMLIDEKSPIEVLSEGLTWSEGPVWVKQFNCLLFSDVPLNSIYKWKQGEGVSVFLNASGYSGVMPYSKEPGTNGLTINNKGELVACEHGNRRISAMPLNHGGKRTLADNYKGKYFNSPNDIIQKSNGDYYFTDPIYGLPVDSVFPQRLKGLYRLSSNGTVDLLIDSLMPNGLAFSPDEKTLYVSQSLFDKAYILSYKVNSNGTVSDGKIFFDATGLAKTGMPGLPDGMKIDVNGNLFATGPGGVLIISPSGKLLGRIETTDATANCAWGDDGSTLYITAHTMLCRVKTKTKGVIH
jgi:gluconolactonase